jgi:opacity protein-like surface antigen
VLSRLIILIGLFGAASVLHAQSEPTATRLGDLKIGGAIATANSDYGGWYNGGGAYFDYDFRPHLGVEGEFHFVKDASDLYEKTYEVGGRYYRTHRKYAPFGKLMYGRGVFNFPLLPNGSRANLAYNLMAVGLGVDYKVKPWLYVRADGEYQHWFGFQNSSLSPVLITVGAAYRFR